MTKKIAIIGAGTAGMSTVILLSKMGFECNLYEEVPEPQAIGAGILLQPQGLKVLQELKLLDEILEKGSIIDTLYGVNNKRKIIMDFNYKDLCSGLFGLGIHRGSLFESLYKVSKQSVKQLYLGHKVMKVTQDKTGAQITTDQGSSQRYDMVVIANGTWSSLTQPLNIKVNHKAYPWGALWKVFDNPNDFSKTLLSQRYIKCHTMAGMLPSGINPNNSKKCVSFFWSLKANKFDEWKDTDINQWKDKATKLWPELNPFIKQIAHHNDLTFVRYADTVMNKWHDNKIVVIGDAAHAMSPQLGQGANMALVDAWQLSQSIKQNKDIEIALAHYSKARKKHLRFYQYSSRILTPFFQSNSKTAAFIRDLVFPPMRYIPMAKKHALTTLFGVKTSVLSNKPNIDLKALAQKIKPI